MENEIIENQAPGERRFKKSLSGTHKLCENHYGGGIFVRNAGLLVKIITGLGCHLKSV